VKVEGANRKKFVAGDEAKQLAAEPEIEATR
jgi:hypothetical protein